MRLRLRVLLGAVLMMSLDLASGLAQQRPLAAEDPRPIPNRAVDARIGFAWEQRAVYPISGLEGEHVSLFPAALSIGVGDRAEFQFEGTVQDYLKPSGGTWRRDFGDLAVGSKVTLFEESGRRPAVTFRNVLFLPNANQASGLGLNTFRFFSTVLAGKTVGRAYIFGGAGAGILEDPIHAAAQQDVLTGNVAVRTALSPRWSAAVEFNGMRNPRRPPAPGSGSRAEIRLSVRLRAHHLDWDVATLGGLTRIDPRFGIGISVTRRFTLPGK